MDITTQIRASIGTLFITVMAFTVRRFTDSGNPSSTERQTTSSEGVPEISPPNPNMVVKSWLQQYFEYAGVTAVSAERVLVRFDTTLDPYTILLILLWLAAVVVTLYKTFKLSSQQGRLNMLLSGLQEGSKGVFVPLHILADKGQMDEKHALNNIVSADEIPGKLAPSRVADFKPRFARAASTVDALTELSDVPMEGFNSIKARTIDVDRTSIGVPADRLKIVIQHSENELMADESAVIQQQERVAALASSRNNWLAIVVFGLVGIIAFYVCKHVFVEKVILTRSNLFTVIGNGLTGVVEPVVTQAQGLVWSLFIEEMIGWRTVIWVVFEGIMSLAGLFGLYKVRGRLANAVKALLAKAVENSSGGAAAAPAPQSSVRPPGPINTAAAGGDVHIPTSSYVPLDDAVNSPHGASASVTDWRTQKDKKKNVTGGGVGVPDWAAQEHRRKSERNKRVVAIHADY